MPCVTRAACRFDVNGKTISIAQTPEILPEDCAYSDLILLKGRVAGPLIRRQCGAILIDNEDLVRHGAYDIFIPHDKRPISYRYARHAKRARRLWAQGYAATDGQRR